jgi:hypothetical protein
VNITIDPAAFEKEINTKLMECVCRASALDGEIASFGVSDQAGFNEQFLAFILANQARFIGTPSSKSLHLFARFAPEPDPLDPVDAAAPFVVGGKWHPGRYDGPSAETLRQTCANHLGDERVVVHPGCFDETIAALPPGIRFGLLHMSGRLYGPSRAALDALFERQMIAEGALILFTQWNANRSSPRFGERRAWAECVEDFAITFSDGGAYGLSSHLLIVHDYRGASVVRATGG